MKENQIQSTDNRRSIKIDLETWRTLKRREADSRRPLYLQIRDLVVSGEPAPPCDMRAPGGGEDDEYCRMVKDCLDAGDPWATQIRGVVLAIYEKMKRES